MSLNFAASHQAPGDCLSTLCQTHMFVRLNHPCRGGNAEPELARQHPSESHFDECQLGGCLWILLSGDKNQPVALFSR